MGITGSAIAAWVGGLSGTTLAVAGAAAVSTIASVSAQKDAKGRARDAAASEDRARAEQKALAAGKAMNEQRQQIREERVRRARILQSAENTGVSESSGEAGAVGSLSTNLGTNLGFNAGALASAGRQGFFLQDAANSSRAAQNDLNRASNWQRAGSLAISTIGSFDSAKVPTKGANVATQKPITSIFDNSLNNPIG